MLQGLQGPKTTRPPVKFPALACSPARGWVYFRLPPPLTPARAPPHPCPSQAHAKLWWRKIGACSGIEWSWAPDWGAKGRTRKKAPQAHVMAGPLRAKPAPSRPVMNITFRSQSVGNYLEKGANGTFKVSKECSRQGESNPGNR